MKIIIESENNKLPESKSRMLPSLKAPETNQTMELKMSIAVAPTVTRSHGMTSPGLRFFTDTTSKMLTIS